MLDVFKAILLGIIEGITEWLPISSTGHIILANEFLKLNVSEAFMEMFEVVIQLGAILAVVVLFWNKLWPFSTRQSSGIMPLVGNVRIKKNSLNLWIRVIISCLPAAIIGLLFDDEINALFFNWKTVAIMLIVYGIAFIVIEIINKNKEPKIHTIGGLDYKTAVFIGLFQVLSMIPGTSRSGATILGAMILGLSRTAAAEFSFYLAVPVMFGASGLKFVKYILEVGFNFTGTEFIILAAGMIMSFIVSILVIKFLLNFIRKNSFKAFGYYRIALGIIVLLYFAFKY